MVKRRIEVGVVSDRGWQMHDRGGAVQDGFGPETGVISERGVVGREEGLDCGSSLCPVGVSQAHEGIEGALTKHILK